MSKKQIPGSQAGMVLSERNPERVIIICTFHQAGTNTKTGSLSYSKALLLTHKAALIDL